MRGQGGFLNRLLLLILLFSFCSNYFRAKASPNVEKLLFILQPGTPVGTNNFVKPELGCQFTGIGGQAFDQFGEPSIGLIARINGNINGETIDYFSVTGSNPKFGPAGFLIQIAETLIETNGELTLKLLNIRGDQLSPVIQINTSDECSKNLLIVNFTEIAISNPLYLPVIRR
jgi:hypothetical protein